MNNNKNLKATFSRNYPYPNPHPDPFDSKTAVARILENPPSLHRRLFFQKGLVQEKGSRLAELDSLKDFARAWQEHSTSDYEKLKLHHGEEGRKFVNPQASVTADRSIPSPWFFRLPSPPEQDGKMETAIAEMIELYWMAEFRETGFSEFSDEILSDALTELRELLLYPTGGDINNPTFRSLGNALTAKNIFRGGELNPNGGEKVGPYISQFLTLDIPFGTLITEQKQVNAEPTDFDGPHMTTEESWKKIQEGYDPAGSSTPSGNPPSLPRHIGTMADLARYVHIDGLYEAYLNAALILLGKKFDFDAGNPYGKKCSDINGQGTCGVGAPDPRQNAQDGFGTFGPTHILTTVCEVASRALKTVWYQKWVAHLRLRPEAFGGVVADLYSADDSVRQAAEEVIGSSELISQIKDSAVIKVIQNKNIEGLPYLPMVYQEGSPMHPAYGAGHATVAGACVTILKAFFDGEQRLKSKFDVPEGSDPLPGKHLGEFAADGTFHFGPELDLDELTVEGELDKLAANISIGRNMAGVHWRSDYTQSILLGQRVAISLLYHQIRDCHEEPWFLTFRTFSGHTVQIVNIRAGTTTLQQLQAKKGFGRLSELFSPGQDLEGVFFTKREGSSPVIKVLGPEDNFQRFSPDDEPDAFEEAQKMEAHKLNIIV